MQTTEHNAALSMFKAEKVPRQGHSYCPVECSENSAKYWGKTTVKPALILFQ